jgi:hypothetical protein
MVYKLAIDFDGVIHDFKHPIEGKRMGPPIEGTKESLKKLRSKGHKLTVFTIWGDIKGKKIISDYMKFYELPFDEITNIKPQADYYIDDKAIHFTDWSETLKQII